MVSWTNNSLWKWSAAALLVAALIVATRFLPVAAWIRVFTEWVSDHGIRGVLAFSGAYILGTVCFLPGSLLTIAAGIAFGLGWGAVIALLSATAGAALAFFIARYVARGAVARQAEGSPRFKAIDRAIGEQGWKIVLLLRLSPLVPFNVSNYFFGLTRVRFWPYVFASLFGMLPGTFLYVYLGYIGKATLTGVRGERSALEWSVLAVGLLATAALTIYLTNLAKKALRAKDRSIGTAHD